MDRAAYANKPLDSWTEEEVQNWFSTTRSGKWQAYAKHFKHCNGQDLGDLEKNDFLELVKSTACNDKLEGNNIFLFNAVQRLKNNGGYPEGPTIICYALRHIEGGDAERFILDNDATLEELNEIKIVPTTPESESLQLSAKLSGEKEVDITSTGPNRTPLKCRGVSKVKDLVSKVQQNLSVLASGVQRGATSKDSDDPYQKACPEFRTFWDSLGSVSVTCCSSAEVGEVQILELPGNALWLGVAGESSPLFVRPCYLKLLDKIKQEEHACKFIITGTPGIGKTTLLSYYLYQLRNEDRNYNIIVDCDMAFACIRPDNTIQFGSRALSFSTELANSSTIYLYDAHGGATPLIRPVSKSIIFSSPNVNNFKEWEKSGAKLLLMPLWDWEELALCRTTCYSAVEERVLRDLYDHWGGVARHTLHWPSSHYAEDSTLNWERAVAATDFKTAVTVAGATLIDTSGGELTHRILHMHVSEDFKSAFIKFASPMVQQKILEGLGSNMLEECQIFLQHQTKACYAALRGQIFESYAHRRLQEGGSFRLRELGSSSSSSSATTITLPTSSRYVHFSDLSDLANGDYGVPKSKTFPAIDAVMLPNKLFQMTVSPNHPISGNALKKIMAELSIDSSTTTTELIYVIPEDLFADFKEQAFTTTRGTCLYNIPPALRSVHQFALCMPLS